VIPLPPIARSRALVLAVEVVAGLAVNAGCSQGMVATADPRPSPTERASPTRPIAVPSGAKGTAVAPPGSTSGSIDLWLLLGARGDPRLVRRTATGPDVGPRIPGPPADTRWASGDLGRGFVARAGPAGGLSALAVQGGRPEDSWRRVGIGAGGPSRPPSFPTLSPDGGRIAATLGDPGSGRADAALLLIDHVSGRTTEITLDGRDDGRPPAWLGDGTVVVPLLDGSDAPALAVVDTASGHVSHRPSLGGAFAASSDGRVVAAADRGSAIVRVGPATTHGDSNAWAAAGDVILPPDGATQAGQLLVDRTGLRLAVTWLDAAGDPAGVTVYGRAGDRWETRAVIPLSGGTEVVVLVGFDP
jgi:hypothetical protein